MKSHGAAVSPDLDVCPGPRHGVLRGWGENVIGQVGLGAAFALILFGVIVTGVFLLATTVMPLG